MVSHVGSSHTGFVDGPYLAFLGRMSLLNADYHGEFTADVFQTWLDEEVLARISALSPHGCAVPVLDRASYHMVLTEQTKPATKSMNKTTLCVWLHAHGETRSDSELIRLT